MSSQPHKEERFMYVIYPGIIISSSLVLTRFPRILQKIVVFCVVLVSFSRVLQVYQAYSAPLKVWQMVSGDVCVGRDWYLFPSSYFLDGELRFYQDGFKGLLPGNFGKEFKMNDRNQEEVDRYFDFEYCDFVVTLNVSEKNVRSELKEWEVKGIEKYIDSQTRQPFRSFFIYPPKVVYGEYLALANKNRSK
jgi:alpha-1,2-mannosyltransferase